MLSLLRRLIPRPPSTNYDLKQIRFDIYAEAPPGSTFLDVGSKSAHGRYSFARSGVRQKLVHLDIEYSEGVNVVADAHSLPFRRDSVDAVLAVGVLQACHDPRQAVAEAYRVLKPGGLFYVSVPFLFPYVVDPYDFYRFSDSGIRTLCSQFDEIQSGFNRGPASSTCHVLIHFLAILFSFNSRRVYGLMVEVFTWGLFWMKYIDKFIGRYETARVIHNGAFFYGRKPSGTTINA